MLTEEQGIKAIIDLQKFADITEPEDIAKRQWNKMNNSAKKQTEAMHKMICGGFPEEEGS